MDDGPNIYNPRKMRWERPDGTPLFVPEQSAETKKPKRDTLILKEDHDSAEFKRRVIRWHAAGFPFGEHIDKPLSEVPTDYLQWAFDEVEFRSEAFETAVSEELATR